MLNSSQLLIYYPTHGSESYQRPLGLLRKEVPMHYQTAHEVAEILPDQIRMETTLPQFGRADAPIPSKSC